MQIQHQGTHELLVQTILLDSFYGTERGLSVSSEARAEISELITQLEAKNPNPAATEASHSACASPSSDPTHMAATNCTACVYSISYCFQDVTNKLVQTQRLLVL